MELSFTELGKIIKRIDLRGKIRILGLDMLRLRDL